MGDGFRYNEISKTSTRERGRGGRGVTRSAGGHNCSLGFAETVEMPRNGIGVSEWLLDTAEVMGRQHLK